MTSALLDPSLAARVAAVSAVVAARAADPERIAAGAAALDGQSAFADLLRRRPASLAFGDAGAAVLCAAFDDADPSGGWDRAGHRFLATATDAFSTPELTLSLFDGATGVLAAAALLSRGGTRYPGLRSQFVSRLLPDFNEAVASAAAREAGHDVVSGLSGWTGALMLEPAMPAEALAAIGTALVDFDPGFPNPGLAHGVSGPLAALALLHDRVPGARAALRALADRVRTAEFENDSWCGGSGGAARALWLAGRALDDAGLLARAEELALRDIGHRTPSFCHGTAGSLLVSALFWWDTGDERHRVHASVLCTRLLESYQPDTLFGFRDVEPDGSTVDNPGVLVGAAGIALVLGALIAPRPPRWPRLFLVS